MDSEQLAQELNEINLIKDISPLRLSETICTIIQQCRFATRLT